MTKKKRIPVVLCWHMHQPQYQDQITQQFVRPWTYLHGIKDYVDMANILREHSQAKAVFNFSPVLLEQLQAYSSNIRAFFDHSEALIDDTLANLAREVMPTDLQQRTALVKRCLQVNEERLIQRFPHYSKLADVAKHALHSETLMGYLQPSFFSDLVTWYHLAWMGETVRHECDATRVLTNKGENFSLEERRWLVAKIGEVISQVIPLYRALLQRKQIEISVTPDKHPIIPLLINFDSATEAMPDVVLPSARYPGGKARALKHLEVSMEFMQDCFGEQPTGCWPSEGSLSDATLALLDEVGFAWTASGAGVLNHSLAKLDDNESFHHKAIKVGKNDINCFFRDDNLSDDIGFQFSKWDPIDAVNNLIHNVLNIAKAANSKDDPIVSIILDGENCWEYYDKNGFHFLNALYETFSQHPDIELTTYSEFLKTKPKHKTVPSLVAGSWVYGTFSTWIGDPSKNRAWEVLCEAKAAYDTELAKPNFPTQLKATAEKQLAICEGSDWFWWFGDYNSAATVAEFDELYRRHIKNLYKVIGVPAPDYLEQPISQGTRAEGQPENAGTMRRSTPTA